MLMDKYPIIITIGAAILGKVGGEMMITDPWIVKTFHPPHWLDYTVQVVCIIGVVLLGKYLVKRKAAKSGNSVAAAEPIPVSEQAGKKE